MNNWFFIAGCQRSGTTLVRLVLECHSKIFCFDELKAYGVLAGDSAYDPDPSAELVGFKIPRWTEQLTNDLLWDDGEPARAPNFYAGQKIIFMVRDPRDTVASMLKLKWATGSWLDLWPRRIIEAKLREDSDFAERYGAEVDACNSSAEPLIALGAFYWKYKTLAYLDYVERGFPVLPVRYEQMVTDSRTVLHNICRFLDVAWEPALLDHPRFSHTETFDDGLTLGYTDPRRAIDARSLNRWHEVLTDSHLRVINEVTAAVEQRLAALY